MITGLLVKEFNRNINPRTGLGSVSIKAFYLRRARRILPAALFVIIAINLWAQFRLNILQVSQLKADSVWTIFFGANITFLRQATDYFAQSNAVSPLQHYWSLSVEEQFYTVWPALFLAALSFSTLAIRGRLIEWQTRLRTVFAVIGIVSFAWLIFEFTNSPTTAYFSTFSRAWELALGGLLSMVSFSSVAERFRPQIRVVRFILLLAVVGAIGIVTPNNFGYTLVIPAVATGLLLLTGAHAKGDLVYRLLSSRVLNGLGAISFSLYLWHWPVFVFGRQEGWMETLPQKAIGVVVCIVLGTVSYFLVEKTFLAIPLPKSQKQGPPKAREFSFAKSRVLTSLTTFAVVAGLVGITYPSAYGSTSTATVASEDWIPPATAASFAPELIGNLEGVNSDVSQFPFSYNRYSASWKKNVAEGLAQKTIASDYQPPSPSDVFEYCQHVTRHFGKRGQVCETSTPKGRYSLALILGDSHATMFQPAISGALDLRRWKVVSITAPSCVFLDVPTKGTEWFPDCLSAHLYANKYLAKYKPRLIFVTQDARGIPNKGEFSIKTKDWELSLRYLKKHTQDLILILPTVGTDNLADCLSRKHELTRCHSTSPDGNQNITATELISTKLKIRSLNTNNMVCLSINGEFLRCPVFIGSTLVTNDGQHYTYPLSQALAPLVAHDLEQLKIPDTKSFSD